MVEDKPELPAEAAPGSAATSEGDTRTSRLLDIVRRAGARAVSQRWMLLEAFLNIAIWSALAAMKARAFAGKPPLYTGDKRIWATIAEAPFFDRLFLLPRRPIVYPLLFKTGLTDAQIITVQLWSSLFSWGLFAYALSRFVPAIIRPLVFAATLLFSLVTPVNAWDLVIRSESTSHSLVAAALALPATLRVISSFSASKKARAPSTSRRAFT